MAVSKVIYGQNTLIDLTNDTVTADKVLSGYTGHDASGQAFEGTYVPSEGGGSLEEKAVNFYDYDGELLYAYTAQEFLALNAFPTNPTHEGLTAQGWNWSLSDAKTYVASYGMLDIGQSYTTDDGKTRLHISFPQDSLESYWTMSINFTASVNGAVTIEWGDNSTTTSSGTNSKEYTHTYAAPGDYTISLYVANGTISFGTNIIGSNYNIRGFRPKIKEVNIGNNTKISGAVFQYCNGLERISLPYGLTTIGGQNVFTSSNLKALVLPNGFTGFTGNTIFSSCYNLKVLCLPNTITSTPSTFLSSCNGLKSLIIPSSVTSISTSLAPNVYSLDRLSIPSSVTQTSSNMASYAKFKKVVYKSTCTPDFSNCKYIEEFDFPYGTTVVGGFYQCSSLKRVSIPSTVTEIASSAFSSCFSLCTPVYIGANVQSIGGSAFQNCYSLPAIYLYATTPPTLGTKVFSNTGNTANPFKIIVPHGYLSVYQNDTNWSAYASRIVEMPA